MTNDTAPEKKGSTNGSASSVILVAIIITVAGFVLITKEQPVEKADDSVQNQIPRSRQPEKIVNPEAAKFYEEGFAAYNAKKFKKCIELTRKAVELDSTNSVAYNNLGAAYNELQMWEDAIKVLNKAIQINPDFQLAKNNLNWAISKKGR